MLPDGAGYLAGLVLAAVFVVAAAGKLARPPTTTAAFRALRIPKPDALARVVPAAELAVAVLLVAVPAVGGLAAAVLLLAFTAVLIRALRDGIRAPCRCFGGVREVPVGPLDVLRNAMLAALAAAAVAAGRPRVPSPAAFGLVAAAVVGGAGALAALRLARGHR